MDTLILPGLFEQSNRQDTESQKTVKLGDNYSQISTTHNSDRAIWQSTSIVDGAKMASTVAALNGYAGAVPFLWRFSPEDPLKPFTCKSFSVTRLSVDVYSVSVEFQEHRSGN